MIDGSGGIQTVFVPTRGASAGLRRLLDGLRPDIDRGVEVCVLVDDPDPRAAAAVRDLAPGVAVIGAVERANLLGALIQAGADARSARASLVAQPGPWRVGALRNLLLLLADGRLCVSIDDDVIPRLVGSLPAAWRLTSGGDPTHAQVFAERRRHWETSPATVTQAHGVALGHSVADLTTTLDVDDARPGLVGAVDAGARVVVTSLGLAGDAGISRATTLLALGGGSALADLPGVLGARTVLRRAPVATVTDAPYLMAACLGLDGRALLPPFFTRYRNTDGLWAACLLRWVRPGLVAHLPAAVLHDPPSRPGFTMADLASGVVEFRVTDLLMMWIGAVNEAHGSPERRLHALGQRVRDLAEEPSLPDRVNDLSRRWVSSMAKLVAGWSAASPHAGLDAARAAAEAALATPPAPVERVVDGRLDERGLRDDLTRFADSLQGWSGLRAAMGRVRGEIAGGPSPAE